MKLLTNRNVLILVTVSIAVWVAAWTLHDSRVLGAKATFEPIPDNVDLSLKNIKYTKTRAGEPLWTLVADSAHSMEGGITLVKNVRLVFFDREMGDIELTADEGALIPEHKTVTVSSNVMVVSSPGNTLQTEYLKFEEATQLLHTDRMVKITRDHFVVSGKGMELDIVKRTLVLLSDVQAQLAGMESI